MKIIVTGAAGCIGSRLAADLVARGHSVVGVDLVRPAAPVAGAYEFVLGSVGDVEIDAGADAIAHLACSSIPATSAADPAADLAENVLPSVRLFERAAAAGVRRIVYASSGGTVYGDLSADRAAWTEADPARPTTAHGAMKLTIENYLRSIADGAGIRPVVARISNAYGRGGAARPGHGAVDSFVRAALAGSEVVIWGDGSTVRDYVHTADVVSALATLLEASAPSPVYNVSTGVGTSLTDLVPLVEAATSRRLRVRFEPRRGFDLARNVLDASHLRRDRGWAPRVTLADGVVRVARAIRA